MPSAKPIPKAQQRKNSSIQPMLWKFLLKISVCLLIVIGFVALTMQFRDPHRFPIRAVKIYGTTQYVEPREIQAILTPMVTTGFFSLNIDSIKDRLLRQPWLADVVVQRVWPNQVNITLIERRAVARWNDDSLLSDAGDLFNPPVESFPNDLPVLQGPEGKQIEMYGYYQQLNTLLSPLHFKISRLHWVPYQSWDITLDNGINLALGQDNILTRVAHFVKVYNRIFGARTNEIASIDLRYPNGMAVRWKSAT